MIRFFQQRTTTTKKGALTLLSLITLNEDALRARLVEMDDDYGFSDFDADTAWTFDTTLGDLMDPINDVLDSGNAAVAGERPHPYLSDGETLKPTERIDLCLLADPDGAIAGYMWTYDLWGARSLSLATGFCEGKNIIAESDGIDGLIEVAQSIVGYVNRAIAEFNEFVGGAK